MCNPINEFHARTLVDVLSFCLKNEMHLRVLNCVCAYAHTYNWQQQQQQQKYEFETKNFTHIQHSFFHSQTELCRKKNCVRMNSEMLRTKNVKFTAIIMCLNLEITSIPALLCVEHSLNA